MADTQSYQPGQHPDLPPPASTVGAVGWVRQNLLSSPLNIGLTFLGLFLLYLVVPPLVAWTFTSAVIAGDSRQVCDMGRTSSRLGEAVTRIDFDNLESAASQKSKTETEQFLSQFAAAVTAKEGTVPADLAAILDTVDLESIKADLTKAFEAGDAQAIRSNLAVLAPIADWGGSYDGACWTFIKVWFKQIMYGRYPDQELWRINLAFIILIVVAIPLFIERVRGKLWIGAFLLIVYPLIAFYLFAGFDIESVVAWPLRLMGLAALALGVAAFLPHLHVLEDRTSIISWALLILVPLWGLSAPSTWTNGLLGGAPAWTGVIGILLAIVPPFLVAAGIWLPQWRPLVRQRFLLFAVLATVLAFIGYALPLFFWDLVAGPQPPMAMAVTAAMLALAVISPWGYDESAGAPGWLARFLLPFYGIAALLVFFGPPDFLNFGVLDWTGNTRPLFQQFRDALPFVETPLWGGLFLTLVIGGTGIVSSLPIGVVLALGRRSNMPVVRAVCVAFIELWRGVPLISVLFMASVMFPLFLPEGVNFDKLVRALLGVALFASAYMAEVVRGGLQAIPKGQYEAAEAMALTYWKSMNLIILPQALKLVIPGIVNSFISLFKDTTLVLIIGLFDLLGMVQLAATNPDWLGYASEGYVFAGFGFWIFCFSMSRYSQYVERKLETGHKR